MIYVRRGGGLTLLRHRYGLKPPQVATLAQLLEFDDPERGCFASQSAIAHHTGLPEVTVRKALRALEEKGCFDREVKPYIDSRGRERPGKIYHYTFAEEVELLVEEAEKLGRQPRQLALEASDDTPDTDLLDRNRVNTASSPASDDAPDTDLLDRNRVNTASSAASDGAPDTDLVDRNRVKIAPDTDLVDRSEVGGGGIHKDLIDQEESSENHHHQPPPRDSKEQALSMQILCHPEIAMPSGDAAKFAALHDPRTILEHCMVYRHELEDGTLRGLGALIYRLRKGQRPRALTQDESGGELYSKFHNDVVDLELENEHEPDMV